MAGEKYLVATAENPFQITIRNILNPSGYLHLGNSSDPISLLRLTRSYSPDFVVVDLNLQLRDIRNTIETIDDEMLCSCILIGEYKDMEVSGFIERTSVISFINKSMIRETMVQTVEMAIINYKRVFQLSRRLKEATENYESRKLIERAKYILMERDGISENEAYTRMRKKSMDTRVSMKQIAEAIIFTHELGEKR